MIKKRAEFSRYKAKERDLRINNKKGGKKTAVSIVITSHKEVGLSRAVDAILRQNSRYSYELVIVSPNEEVLKVVEMIKKKHKEVWWCKDAGRWKSAALNKVLPLLKGEIIVFTDGDVVLLPGAVNEIVGKFEDPLMGCVSGRVVSANPRTSMLGFWSHLLADAGAHKVRTECAEKNKLVECTGYLFACRNHLVKNIPVDVAEDAIIPYMMKQKGYRTGYAEYAKVLV